MVLFRLNVGHDPTWVFLWNQFVFSASLFRKCCSGKPDVFSSPRRIHRGSSVSAATRAWASAGPAELSLCSGNCFPALPCLWAVWLLVFCSGKSRAGCIPEKSWKKYWGVNCCTLWDAGAAAPCAAGFALGLGFFARKRCWCSFPKLLSHARVIPAPSFLCPKGRRALWGVLHPVQAEGWGHQHETSFLPVPFHQSLQGEPAGALQERPGVHRGRKSFTLLHKSGFF